jgi:geranylgeranyl pyrophosphate synthase
VGGQADDLAAESTGGDIASLEAIHRRKTGALFLASLRMGGLVARADSKSLTALEEYGRRLGLAFQIVDDLLDARGNAQALGKRAHHDRERGKLTFPSLLGIEESSRRATGLIEEAIAALKIFGSSASRLEALARFVAERNR